MTQLKLTHGIYESVITHAIQEKIDAIKDDFEVDKQYLDSEESHFALALHLAKRIATSLSVIKGEDKKQRQVQFCNQLLKTISEHDTAFPLDAEKIVEDLMCLLKIQDKLKKPLDRPGTPLTNACLFTGTNSDLTLESQLVKEIRTADQIDIICSFIKWSGIRLLKQDLEDFTAQQNVKLRIITTSYLGATDLKAVEYLQKLPNTELLVSYDTKRTRLHAKSYIFHRNSGFGSAYIGSSNISNPALTSGLEWNLKISQFESPYLWEKICATFEAYQNSTEFSRYDESSRNRLKEALAFERGNNVDENIDMSFLDICPYPYQQEILDRLSSEREIHHRMRNLIVAATGTGKTVIAAFDYKRIRKAIPNAKFLFIAHREEILKKSRFTFRHILKNQNFGELLVGQHNNESYEHLFVSIQSINSREFWNLLQEDYYDYIVVDEFHHSASESYQKLLKHFKPKYLLALTATPERHDGLDVLSYFDGHIAAEIRLPDAINRKLLSPFQYFGITDIVDLSNVAWVSGHYEISALNQLFNGNETRAQLVVEKMAEILLDINKCRALCFCVSQDHASFMNDFFNSHGVKSLLLTAESPNKDRDSAQSLLENCAINVICVVDIYNEGVDIPSIDTVLFLRPTESLTLFLQQFGRGLRLHEDKECLTVLDFVGNANRNFNFESRFRAMLSTEGKNISDELKNGFPHLPAGCFINLEKQAKEYILRNIEHNIYNGRINQLVGKVRTFTGDSGLPLSLANFIDYYHIPLSVIYKRKTFSRICAEAGLISEFNATDEQRLTRGFHRICHLNSAYQLKTLLRLLRENKLCNLSCDEERFLTMLHFSLWGKDSDISLNDGFLRLKNSDQMFDELIELLSYLFEHTDIVTSKPDLPYSCPLELHANYTRDEILAALGNWNIGNTPELREGVKYINELKTDIFFITLNKSEKSYSPTTMYLDYALSDDLFHMQSQSTTSVESPTGQRYIKHKELGNTILLFVRDDKNKNGQSNAYCFLGPAEYQNHTGTRPINIEWKLKYKMPAKLCRMTERMATA